VRTGGANPSCNAETGLLLLMHRYLDPATGRFLTRDPSGFEGGINLYAYVGNGVVNKIDAEGLWEVILPCVHLQDGSCIGYCKGDPKCKGNGKPGPKPTPPYKPPRPSQDICIRNPRPTDLPSGCYPYGAIIICKPEDCFKNFNPRFGPWTKERCTDCCHAGKYVWSRHQLGLCESLCESDPPHIPRLP